MRLYSTLHRIPVHTSIPSPLTFSPRLPLFQLFPGIILHHLPLSRSPDGHLRLNLSVDERLGTGQHLPSKKAETHTAAPKARYQKGTHRRKEEIEKEKEKGIAAHTLSLILLPSPSFSLPKTPSFLFITIPNYYT